MTTSIWGSTEPHLELSIRPLTPSKFDENQIKLPLPEGVHQFESLIYRFRC